MTKLTNLWYIIKYCLGCQKSNCSRLLHRLRYRYYVFFSRKHCFGPPLIRKNPLHFLSLPTFRKNLEGFFYLCSRLATGHLKFDKSATKYRIHSNAVAMLSVVDIPCTHAFVERNCNPT